jgi:hypothetical protein
LILEAVLVNYHGFVARGLGLMVHADVVLLVHYVKSGFSILERIPHVPLVGILLLLMRLSLLL